MRALLVLLLIGCSGGGGMMTDGGGGGGGSGGGSGAVDAGPLPLDYDAVGLAITVQGGKVVVVGAGGRDDDAKLPNWFLARLNTDGTLDPTLATRGYVDYDFDGGSTGAPTTTDDGATAVLADGDKIVAAGWARGIPTVQAGSIAVARFNADGTIDTTFGGGAGYALFDFNPMSVTANVGSAYTLAKRADGKYVLAGGFDNGTRSSDMFAYRLNADGTVDGTFTPTPLHNGSSEIANDVVVQGNNVVLGGGTNFASCRLTDTGALDMSYGVMGWSTSSGGTSYKLLARGDGRLLSVGLRSLPMDRAALKLYQTSADGVADATFGMMGVVELGGMNMGPEGEIRGAALAADGSLYVLTNSLRGSNVVKVKADGTLDTAWAAGGEKPSGFKINILSLLTSVPRGANALTLDGTTVWVTGATLVQLSPGSSTTRFAINKVP